MGEAKRRGTKSERVAVGIERRRAEALEESKRRRRDQLERRILHTAEEMRRQGGALAITEAERHSLAERAQRERRSFTVSSDPAIDSTAWPFRLLIGDDLWPVIHVIAARVYLEEARRLAAAQSAEVRSDG